MTPPSKACHPVCTGAGQVQLSVASLYVHMCFCFGNNFRARTPIKSSEEIANVVTFGHL